MPEIREIRDGKKVLAIVFRHRLQADGVKFLTPQTYPLQIGLLQHPKGKVVRAHRHRNLRYNVSTTQEFLYIETGKVQATIYRNDWSVAQRLVLEAGDFILSVSGGHGFKMLKPSRIIEIKQGPYPGDKLAKLFKPGA